MVTRLRHRLATAGGVPADAPPEVLAAAVARRYPRANQERLVQALQPWDGPVSRRALSEQALFELARRISDAEQEITRHDH